MKPRHLLDWNVIVTVRDRGFIKATELLQERGPVVRTEFFNVLVMKVGDQQQLMEFLRQEMAHDAELALFLARVIPLTTLFDYQTAEEFEEKMKEAVASFLPILGGKSFHARMHRRGFKGRLSSIEEERLADELLLDELEKRAAPGKISFDRPDVILAIETVGQRAGLSAWTRDELDKYPFLGLD